MAPTAAAHAELVPAVGQTHRIRALGEGFVHRISDQHAAEWHVPGVDAFRENQEVRGHAIVVDREPGTGAAEADQYLVGDEDDAMTGAQLPGPRAGSRSAAR